MHFIVSKVYHTHVNLEVKKEGGNLVRPTEDALKKRGSPQN